MNRALCLIAGILADLGEITSGHLKNSGNTAAIRLSGTGALPTTNFIDFTATGTSPFLKHPGATLLADGTATFTAVSITAQTAVSKVLRIPFAEFIPYDSAQSYRFNPGRLTRKPGDAVSNSRFMCPLVLPKGVTVTLATMRGLRAHTSDITLMYLYRNDDSGTATVIAGPLTHSAAANTWESVSSSTLSQLVGDQHYTLEVELDDAGSGTSGGTAFAWAEITYTMPDYAKSI